MKGYVYILQSNKNGRYYVGSSNNPIFRLNNYHNLGKVKSTKYLIPWIMKFFQEYSTITQARIVERKLKQMKSKVIVEQIIKNQKCTIKVG